MSKEINIDEILTRSKKQAEEKKSKASKIIDSDTGEEMDSSPQKDTKGSQRGFGGPTGMPGDFSEIFNNPDVMKMFSGGTIPGYKNLPLKQRIMFKLMGFFAKPGRAQLLKKKILWPIWAILLIILLVLAIVVAAVVLVFKLLFKKPKMVFGDLLLKKIKI